MTRHHNIDNKKVPFTPEEEIARDKEEAAYEAKQAKTQYQRDRKPFYGTWEQQLDMMYHGTWKDHVAKIKRDIPKENK
tara:strand:+ start:484 stop:717 length:234 start_codon:yes stop_codon:yes gene_type:complete